jgi:cell division protein FtsA
MQDTIVGIDMGSFSTRVVVAHPPTHTTPPLVVGYGVTDTEGVRRGYIVDAEKAERSLRHALARAEKMAEIKIKRAYVAVSGQSLTSDIVDVSIMVSKGDSQVTQFDVDSLEEKAEQTFYNHKKNKKILHIIPLYFQIDGEDIMGNPVGMRGTKIEARFLCMSTLTHHLEDFVNVINNAGVSIIDVVASPLAISLATLSARQRTVGVAILDIGAEITTLTLFENDKVLGVTTIPIGSSDITNDIALGLKVTLDEARKIKEEYTTKDFAFSKRKISEVISARLGDIFDMTNKYLQAHRRKGLLPAGVVITGAGSLLHDIKTYAEQHLELTISIANVQQRFGQATKLLPDNRFITAYSLCFLDSEATPSFSNNIFKKATSEGISFVKRLIEQFMP